MNRIKQLLSDKDERTLFFNIFMAFAVKGISLIVSLFSMPLYIKYFNNDAVLGLWYTILSMLSWINVCDLGLGNGLRNRLTEALAKKDSEQGTKYVSSTYAIVTSIILPVSVIIILGICLFDLNAFLNIPVSVISPETLRLSLIILLIGVAFSFILKIINSIIYAIQKSSLNNVISLIVSILPLIFVFVFDGKDVEQNLIYLSIVHALAVNLPLVAATVLLFGGKTLKEYKPSFKNIEKKTAKKILGFGFQFFLAQIFFMILISTNEIFITRLFSPSLVVEYSIYYRLFTIVGSLFTLALTPLWSKVTKDLAEKKYRKIKYTNRVLYVVSLLAIICEVGIIPFLQPIVNIWLGKEAIAIDYKIALIFALFGGLYILNIVLTTVANGIGNLKSQIVFYGVGALLKIPGVILLKQVIGSWWIVTLYTCFIILAFCLYQFVWVEKNIKKLILLEEKNEFV